MLRWTGAGAVESPRAVQIRVTPLFGGRVPAAAPTPDRAMTPAEVEANLAWFVADRGPRARGCDALVLSGADPVDHAALAAPIAAARDRGLKHVTLHLARGAGARLHGSPLVVDAVATTAASPADLDDVVALRGAVPYTSVSVVLSRAALPGLPALIDAVVSARPDRVVLTWPFPPAEPPPVATEAAQAVRAALPALSRAGIVAGVKGLPPCVLPGVPAAHLWRSGNRWYVDAGHQLGAALLFFPDVVRFTKPDVCRFCAASARCDGVIGAWLDQGLVGPLTPLVPGSSDTP